MTVREELWPNLADYGRTVRDPSTAFQGWPELAGGTVRAGPIPGLPWSASGANAIVFSMRTTRGHQIAVRCFTRHPPNDVDERYRALGRHLDASPCPVFAGFQWTDQAIVVDDKRWPVLQMEWIDGSSLKPFVADCLDRRADIEQLSETWKSVVAGLEAGGYAHGDLQHGNIIVSSPSSLRLVDLDEVYCAGTERFGTNESGLPAYQHPQRMATGAWGRHIDRFSSIVIYTSLRAIASARRPRDLLSRSDALVLSADDIRAAADENARDEAWEFLLKNPDGDVCRLADQLHAACRMPLHDVPSLDDVLRQLPRADAPPLNEWSSQGATPGRIDNQWPAPGTAAAEPGRRSKREASPQQWTDGTDEHRRTSPQMPPQSWPGARSGSRPAAPRPAAATSTTPRAPAPSRAMGWLAMVVGVIIFLLGAAFTALDYAIGLETCEYYEDCEKGSFAFFGIVAAVAGLSIVGWGRRKAKR